MTTAIIFVEANDNKISFRSHGCDEPFLTMTRGQAIYLAQLLLQAAAAASTEKPEALR